MQKPTELPANVRNALQRGDTVEAIQHLRTAYRLGLKEAKDIIDAHLSGQSIDLAAPSTAPAEPLPAPVMQALQQGNKIEAIKLLREQTGLDLQAAKEMIDAAEGSAADKRTGLAPGEVPRSGALGWLVVFVVLAAIAYYFSRHSS